MDNLFDQLEIKLREKGVSKEEILKAKDEVEKYIRHLQKESALDLNIPLKEFVHARR